MVSPRRNGDGLSLLSWGDLVSWDTIPDPRKRIQRMEPSQKCANYYVEGIRGLLLVFVGSLRGSGLGPQQDFMQDFTFKTPDSALFLARDQWCQARVIRDPFNIRVSKALGV